jgi:thioredoxin 1
MSWLKNMFGMNEKHPPVSLNDGNFRQEVKQYRGAVLVDVWGPNCAPCAKLAPIMEELSTEYRGKVKVCELNAAVAPRSAGSLGVRGTPTIVAFKEGAEIGRIVGWKPKSFWKELIETEFADYVAGEAVGTSVAADEEPVANGRKPNSKAAKKAAKKARRSK